MDIEGLRVCLADGSCTEGLRAWPTICPFTVFRADILDLAVPLDPALVMLPAEPALCESTECSEGGMLPPLAFELSELARSLVAE
jgi:hypothetical protein